MRFEMNFELANVTFWPIEIITLNEKEKHILCYVIRKNNPWIKPKTVIELKYLNRWNGVVFYLTKFVYSIEISYKLLSSWFYQFICKFIEQKKTTRELLVYEWLQTIFEFTQWMPNRWMKCIQQRYIMT